MFIRNFIAIHQFLFNAFRKQCAALGDVIIACTYSRMFPARIVPRFVFLTLCGREDEGDPGDTKIVAFLLIND